MINGPMNIAMPGISKPAIADKWQSMAQFLASLVNSGSSDSGDWRGTSLTATALHQKAVVRERRPRYTRAVAPASFWLAN